MWRWRRKAEDGADGQPNSLFGEILDWLLAPLLFLWPISIIVTYQVAGNIANQPHDLALADNVRTLSRLLSVRDGQPVLDFPAAPRLLFRSDHDDVLYFQVVALDGFVLLAGDEEIPRPGRLLKSVGEEVLYRDELIHGEEVRVAWSVVELADASAVLVQLAETRNKRSALASSVVTGVLLPQFAIIPLAVLLVWVGLSRGIAPLSRLQGLIQRRRPTDLSPVAPASVPEEVRPLIIAFNGMMGRLEENLQAQQRFIADAAHQMHTPLTGLKMQADLALHESDPVELHRSLVRIAESADRAAHLINQLLALARAESSFEKLYVVEPVSLEGLVNEVALELYPYAQHKEIDLGAEGECAGLCIEGNPVLLRELIKNLVDNAIKYTPRRGRVTVRTCFDGQPVLEVEDSGPGIPLADRERVFQRFYRVLGSGADGSGLGLPIVREIAELHRAVISLHDPAGGQGVLIRVSFPLPGRGAEFSSYGRPEQAA